MLRFVHAGVANRQASRHLRGPADVSPSTERIDRVHKLPICARERVGHAWLINPVARTLEVYRRSSEGWLLVGTHEGDAPARAEPFDAIELDLLALWGETRHSP